MRLRDRVSSAWNVFTQNERKRASNGYESYGPGSSYQAQNYTRSRYTSSSERSILASIYNTIAVDATKMNIYHVRKDENDRYVETITSGLNECLTVEANIDQSGSDFRRDVYMSILEHGVIAIVPVETSDELNETGSYDISELRVGTITQWYPRHVTINLYNGLTGMREDITLPKRSVAIVENPFYSVMNEPNSTYQRLVKKLNLLDVIDEQTSSGKLDIIIQLPYVVKNSRKKEEAETRAKDIETQLKDSKYGIAYIDGTERITQLNRPAENNLLTQVEKLDAMLHTQLGITNEVLNGTATDSVMTYYRERTVKPLVNAVLDAMIRVFLTKTARTQGQDIQSFEDVLSMIPSSQLADLADKLTRNEILSSNEFRAAFGFVPVDDERANALVNKNMPPPDPGIDPYYQDPSMTDFEGSNIPNPFGSAEGSNIPNPFDLSEGSKKPNPFDLSG